MTLTQRIGGAYVAVQPGEARHLQSVERRNQDGYLPLVYTITLEDYPARVVFTLEESDATLLVESRRWPHPQTACGVDLILAPDDAMALRDALELLGVTYWQDRTGT